MNEKSTAIGWDCWFVDVSPSTSPGAFALWCLIIESEDGSLRTTMCLTLATRRPSSQNESRNGAHVEIVWPTHPTLLESS